DDDEWEYEYDEVETEDFYVALDLSNIPSSGRGTTPKFTGPSSGHESRLYNRLRDIHQSERDASLPLNDERSAGQIQISGLHTQNPLIVYNGQLLSCKWASTVGTEIFFAKPEEGSLEEPLRKLPSVDLIGFGSTKLMATSARLRLRNEAFGQVEMDDQQPTDAMEISEDTGTPTEATRLPAPSFIERLNQAKAKRGDQTRMAVFKGSDGAHLVAEKV
ncbi:hypothetical protein EJ04DRAFT_404283, partial [Polyplosphaeria fusca]